MAVTVLPSANKLFFVILTLLLLSKRSEELKVSGTLETTIFQSWEFLTRFCFLSKAGRLQFEFYYPRKYDEGPNAAQNILLYHDIQWPEVYPSLRSKKEQVSAPALTCYEKESVLLPENNQVINLTTRYRWSGCSIIQINGEEWYECKGGRTFSSKRERWWYIVVDNCATTQGLFLNYNITMTNDLDEDNFFFKHYSADEFYILQETIAFFLAYMFLLCLSLYVAYSLHIRQLYHTTFKLYLASLCVEYLALIAQLIYWVDYGYSGIPIANWKNLGRFLDFASQVIFVILLILMGKGYTITRGRISVGGTIKIIVFSIVFICVTIAMIIWEIVSFDPALVLYLYDSLPGYALIGVRILSWVWFLYGIGFTLKHFPEKMSFYVPFLIVYTVWFWFGNTVALIAIDTIPVWIKEKVVQGCMLFVTFFGHLVFLILTWPTMANKTFPYHIKTTQVGAMDPQPRTTGPGVAIETGMGGGAYTPNGVQVPFEPDGEKRFIEMFTTDRSSNSVHTASRKD